VSRRQRAGLSAARWAEFDFTQQILMIANELHRATKLVSEADRQRRRSSLERVYALVDLTLAASSSPSRRRELLRWREMLGDSYLDVTVSPKGDRALLRTLLQLSPTAAGQIPFVVP
jgi:hypothetical protein